MGEGGQHHAPAALPPGMPRYALYRRLGGAPGMVWMGAENLSPHRYLIPGPSGPQWTFQSNVQKLWDLIYITRWGSINATNT